MTNPARASDMTAAVLSPKGVMRRQASGHLWEFLNGVREHKDKAYGAWVYHDQKQEQPDSLAAHSAFIRAYCTAMAFLEHEKLEVPRHEDKGFFRVDSGTDVHVRLYIGDPSRRDLKGMEPTPGFYILCSALDTKMLERAGLPPMPELVKHVSVVAQVNEAMAHWDKAIEIFESLSECSRGDPDDQDSPEKPSRDTREWRDAFIKEYQPWSSIEVAAQHGSTAKNRAALANRWLGEGKVFSVRFGGQHRFPRFQFKDGAPLPAMAQIIQNFPAHTNGWDIAYFLTTPNTNIGGRKPADLLNLDPERIISLARAFASPADVF